MPLVIAHRGFSAAHRENSPAAWSAAVDAGADIVETDIRFTRDGVAVCCHDADLRRLAGRGEAIRDVDAAALAAIRAGGHPAAPRLEQLFETLPPDAAILFDVKDERPEALERLLDAIAASGRSRIFLGLHSAATVRHVRPRSDRTIVGLLTDPGDEAAFLDAGGDILRLWESEAGGGRVEAHAEAGRAVWVTTGHKGTNRPVGDFEPEILRRLAERGAAGFLVNDPVAAREALAGPEPAR